MNKKDNHAWKNYDNTKNEYKEGGRYWEEGFHLVCLACGDNRLRPFEQEKGLCSSCAKIVWKASVNVEEDNDYVMNEMYRNPMGYESYSFDEDAEKTYQGYDE